MKILFDAHLSENKITGIGRYINELLTTLLHIDSKNQYYILINEHINSRHPLKQIKKKNVNLVSTQFKGLSFGQYINLKKYINHIKPDIYHHPHFDLPCRIKIPTVITIHDLKYIVYPQFFPKMGLFKRKIILSLTRRSVINANKIICVSNSTKHDILNVFHINYRKITTIYHGYKNFRGSNNSLITNSNKIIKLKPYILFVGERRPHKNLLNLLKAFSLLRSRVKNINLVIVGKKYKDYTEPERLIDILKLKKNVYLFEYVEDEYLKSLYLNGEMFIFPSLYEGFGFPILEAMSAGLPVIGSNNSSIPELINKAGIILDSTEPSHMASQIEAILNDKVLKSKLSNLSIQRIKKFSWQKCAERTLAVYEDLYFRKHVDL